MQVKINEKTGWKGDYDIYTLKPFNGIGPLQCLEHEYVGNIITYVGENLMRDALLGVETDLKIDYFALGSGTTTPNKSETQLVSEFFRKPVTTRFAGGNGQAITFTVIGATEANGVFIGEIATFVQAIGVVNDGKMISRVKAVNRIKTGSEIIQIVRTDTILGV